jgi:hypothetical protein
MKRLKVLWLFAVILIVSCQKSELTVSPLEQQEIAKRTGGYTYSITISPVNEINTTCSDLMLNVETDKTSRGKIVLCEYEGPYHHVVINKWEATNTNSIVVNTGNSQASERYFDATFTWGSTIIIGSNTIGIESCQK